MAAPLSSPKRYHLLEVHGALSLPLLSLALLAGFTLSLSLLPVLQAIVPPMESVLFVSLPHLWHALLSWVTPPCLFVFLNGIIVILTATSRISSNLEAALEEGQDFSVMEVKMENVEEQSGPLEMAIVAVEQPEVDDGACKGEMLDLSAEDLQLVPLVSQSVNMRNGGIGNGLEQAHQEGVEEFPNEAIRDIADAKDCDNGDINDDVFYDVLANQCDIHLEDVPLVSEDLRLEWPIKHETTPEIEDLKTGSQPNSCPHHSLPSSPIKNNMRRSFSIDSAELSMSDEDFRKWIDDFISNKYAKLRSEGMI